MNNKEVLKATMLKKLKRRGKLGSISQSKDEGRNQEDNQGNLE